LAEFKNNTRATIVQAQGQEEVFEMFNHNENFTIFESNTTEAVVQAQG